MPLSGALTYVLYPCNFLWIGSTSGKYNSMIQSQYGFCGCWRVKMTVMVRRCLGIWSRMDFCTLWMKKCHVVFTPPKLYALMAIKSSLLEYYHDHPLAGHLGMTKTIVRPKIRFYWPKFSSDTKKKICCLLYCLSVHETKPVETHWAYGPYPSKNTLGVYGGGLCGALTMHTMWECVYPGLS